MDGISNGGRIGNALSEALGLSSPGAEGVARQQWQQAAGAEASGGRGGSALGSDAAVSPARLSAGERAGETGELHPRGRFLNLRV